MHATRLRGARTNNLKGVDLDLAPGSLVVIAGPSGAGKSSLAFSTLYAEGQRRYVESFSAYARQFLERLARPPVDSLEPVPAAIAVDRQAPVRTSRSTVGTMTEVSDYAKSFFARAASLDCPSCGERVERDAPGTAAARVLERAHGAKVIVSYPLAVEGLEQWIGVREALAADGYRRLRVGGEVRDLDDVRPSELFGEAATKSKPKKKTTAKKKKGVQAATAATRVDVVADRLVADDAGRPRLTEALEAAFLRGAGRADVHVSPAPDGHSTFHFSTGLHCARCDRYFRDATPGLFSFNNPIGACDTCRGFGRVITVDWDRVIPDDTKTLDGGAIAPWTGKSTTWERRELKKRADAAGMPLDVPVRDLTPEQRHWLIEGDGRGWTKGWAGIRAWFQWLESRAYKMHVRVFLSRYRKYETCATCDGTRLKSEARWFRVDGVSIDRFLAMTATDAREFVERVTPRFAADAPTALVLRELHTRLATLCDVGLGYVTLDRASRTLSGGEAQRVSLAGALGAALTGAMFVLDEPTVGLHPSDVERLVAVVRRMTGGTNTVLVVEHDSKFFAAADRVIELGPGAGEDGGRVVFDGEPSALSTADTTTGRALRTAAEPMRRVRRQGTGQLVLRGARGHNLKNVTLTIPTGTMTCVTGVSGSGKSTLVLETLVPAMLRRLGKRADAALEHDGLDGIGVITDVIHVDQASLGRTSRGNPATYLGVWDAIRAQFAKTELAKEREYTPGFFSFNVPGGRCEACRGEGAETVEMQFLADVTFTCPECGGSRFAGPVLDVRVQGLNVAQVLGLTAREALAKFGDDRDVATRLTPLVDVGLGYLRLGQALSSLSGGESQRLKLAYALAGADAGALIVLDEPTAGLHDADVAPLLTALDCLVDRGNTVVVVEHDMRVAAFADRVVDLGPGASAEGGRIVAEGTPEDVASSSSRTAPYLRAAIDPTSFQADRVKGNAATLAGEVIDLGIEVSHARENNLKDVDVRVPREKLVVVTGPSGSGKSTLAFDVIHAEAQRRYVETLSPYARQYLPQLPRPAVDRVAGLPPSVSVEQRVHRAGGMSTVSTMTEIAHHMRVLWARAGLLHCPDCNVPIGSRHPTTLADDVRKKLAGSTEIRVMAPVVRARKGHHQPVFARMHKDGFREARVDGTLRAITPDIKLSRFREHDIDVVVARIKVSKKTLSDSISRALSLGSGIAKVEHGSETMLLSSARSCPSCGRGFPELDPRFFSFHTKQGACETCEGRGTMLVRVKVGKHMREEERACRDCDGTRLSDLARAVTLDGRRITDVLGLCVHDAVEEVRKIKLSGRELEIGRVPLEELGARLRFLDEVGLGYLGLDRPAPTLSGGETQRVRLAGQLGAGLTGILYVLDEPTIGLHPRDTTRLLGALRGLVDRGCSVLVVEHDTDTIRAADWLIDVGPGGGKNGGTIVAAGPSREVLASDTSVTAKALRAPSLIPTTRREVRSGVGAWLGVSGARAHNLQRIDVSIPLGRLVAITGVSGSGKSTFARDVLLRGVRRGLGLETDAPGEHDEIRGLEHLKRAIEIDQSPIGRTPRSVPATYVGIWDELRRTLAASPDARARGYTASRFSFNVSGGRCEACEGQGARNVEMAFLPDVLVRCEACDGRRFGTETCAVKLRGLDASEILALEVGKAVEVLGAFPKVARPLKLLDELGLGYLTLGQASSTLSGGEAQRIKLVAELGTSGNDRTLYVMDEPTTGLHRSDVVRLVGVLERLVERGDTVVVIEHHPDVIAAADWVIDLGPEGGAAGGRVVAAGTPEHIAKINGSHTGRVIRELLGSQQARAARSRTSSETHAGA